MVAFFELIKCLALVGFNHITDKLLSMDVENFCIWALSQQAVANRVHQVGFAQADAAINKQRVVQVARHACYVHGCRPCHTVCPALDQRVKVQARIEPIFLGFGGASKLGARTILRGQNIGNVSRKLNSHRLLFESKCQLKHYRLARKLLQQVRNPTAVLGSYPVHLESVCHKNCDLREFV